MLLFFFMNVDKYLGIITNRLSFNYIAFQAVTLFLIFVAVLAGTAQFALFPIRDKDLLLSVFGVAIFCFFIIFLFITFLEFIYFFRKKQLSQKLFSKQVMIFHLLFTYLLCTILVFNRPTTELMIDPHAFDMLLYLIMPGLYISIILFSFIPAFLFLVIELAGRISLEPMPYLKNIWRFWGLLIALSLFLFFIIGYIANFLWTIFLAVFLYYLNPLWLLLYLIPLLFVLFVRV